MLLGALIAGVVGLVFGVTQSLLTATLTAPRTSLSVQGVTFEFQADTLYFMIRDWMFNERLTHMHLVTVTNDGDLTEDGIRLVLGRLGELAAARFDETYTATGENGELLSGVVRGQGESELSVTIERLPPGGRYTLLLFCHPPSQGTLPTSSANSRQSIGAAIPPSSSLVRLGRHMLESAPLEDRLRSDPIVRPWR